MWEAGNRGILTAETARVYGVVRLVAEDPGEIRRVYGLDSTADLASLESRGRRARAGRHDQPGLAENAAQGVPARAGPQQGDQPHLRPHEESGRARSGPPRRSPATLSELKGIETVAYIEEEALGLSALMPLACDKIVFKQGGRMGDVTPGDERPQRPDRGAGRGIGRRRRGRGGRRSRRATRRPSPAPWSIPGRGGRRPRTTRPAPSVALLRDRTSSPAATRSRARSSRPGEVLTLTGRRRRWRSAWPTRSSQTDEELWSLYGLEQATRRPPGPTWVDSLVTILNTRWMSGLLLFVGLFMLVLELKLPGIGLPAIISALAFLLFFWSHYLSGTADQLEIILFLVGPGLPGAGAVRLPRVRRLRDERASC